MERKKDQESIGGRPGGFSNRLEPIYKWNERLSIDDEVEPPPSSLFRVIGFNKTPADGIRHYRRYFADELENI